MMQLREATIEDLAVLVYWDGKQHVIDSDPTGDWNWAVELNRRPPWREQLMAEWNGRPIGFVQIIDPLQEETGYWGTVDAGKRAVDIWIGEESDLRKGYGTMIMTLIADRIFADPDVSGILVDPLSSNTDAHRFYRKLGFAYVDERDFAGDRCMVFELRREVYDYR
ncbi:Aminoglycoside N(6')-acetyltransferase type 1 [Neolewinella maritima]|uniref:Aminoglycoside N(6')-acetyltransferase type 1 n=1 Tax=Neolewinella maritima TaxID=1383882 RepID=A0ABM9AYI3_9BACT|nr:GNAT family N-acetyltransferase [Neolewinella maritima]CAH0999566.1 Aminoglycoside N(6')-acetyltransferase type 1 [Neolewinella maritima]